MITEDYVSFEVAKLLKEKGFNQDYYNYPVYWMNGNNPILSFEGDDDFPYSQNECVAPSFTSAMKWFREVHNLNVEVYRTACGYIGCIVAIPSGTDKKFFQFDGDDEDSGQYTTWEKACEAAIKYCLEYLINK